ncbi:preprotein translocase subunit SecE [Pseudaeromonas sp. ZJS20]|uniref:preprotein translocase subunit SecE n=1 Tax=Pseudaeromonas aegiceratis TaxID=3153928 RepID=UPI00390C6323
MSVNIESQGGSKAKDILLWCLTFILLAAAVLGNYLFSEQPAYVRFAGVIVALVIAGVIAFQTATGKGVLAFARESRMEVRKVVWPTRQEAIQTTLIIFAVTAVVGLFLFLLDGLLIWLVGLITGVQG